MVSWAPLDAGRELDQLPTWSPGSLEEGGDSVPGGRGTMLCETLRVEEIEGKRMGVGSESRMC